MIHRYWTGDGAGPFEPWLGRAVRSMHYGVTDWTDDTLPAGWNEWLDEHASKVIEKDLPRHRANMVRWRLLWERGGVWMDSDVIPLRNLEQEVGAWTAAIGDTRTCAIVKLPPGHGLARAMLDAVENYSGPPASCPYVSGDKLLNTMTFKVGRLQLPFGSNGACMNVEDPVAVHVWVTSSDRIL